MESYRGEDLVGVETQNNIVLVKGESGDRMLLGLVVELHHDSNGDVFGATVE